MNLDNGDYSYLQSHRLIKLFTVYCKVVYLSHREEYELKVNTITLDVHFEQLYTFKDGAIQSLAGGGSHLELEIDRRKTIEDLILAVTEVRFSRAFIINLKVIQELEKAKNSIQNLIH